MNQAHTGLAAALADRYRLERELGQGGMATVYLAHDLKHQRSVAIKVLRPELAAVIGAERFLSEIKTTANLQHPHILPLFDSGAADSFLFYVMPFIEGESLRDRLNREKQLPINDAVRIATEIAGALDYAHRRGVIHRDIKPENILLHDGSALVADFGIALAASKAGGTRMTESGMSLGTPHYMSPEQAMGEREITARSDVYALGCVTYEMLLGEPPFSGPTAQAIVAKVMTEKPAGISSRRDRVPPHVEDAVLTALEKLPADRFATAGEFAAALGDAGTAPRRAASGAAVAGMSARSRGGWAARLPWAVAAAAAALAAWSWLSRPAPAAPSWQQVALGDSVRLNPFAPGLALAPDGRTLAFRDAAADAPLWVKRWGQLAPERLAGTEGASSPAFSPDGTILAFTAGGRLLRMPSAGGPAMVLADSAAGPFYSLAWLPDGSIIYVGRTLDVLRRWRPDGRTVEVALDDATLHGFGFTDLAALPGSRGLLFVACQSNCNTSALRVLDLATGSQKALVANALTGRYVPPGHLLYLRRDGALLAAPFDLDRLELTGAAVPVVDGLWNLGVGVFDVSRSGTLAFVPGGEGQAGTDVVRVTRGGIVTPLDTVWPGPVTALALSQDGRWLAVSIGVGQAGSDVWLRALDRGPVTRLSFGGQDRRPAWSPDGRMVAFIRDTNNGGRVYGRLANGIGEERLLAQLDRPVQEVAWSGDGRWLVVRTDNGTAGAGDIVGIRVDGDTTPMPLVATPKTELQPMVSRDGRWLAYASNESGAAEVYVRPFPETAGSRWQVSNGGGDQPTWSADGRELYYLAPSARLMAVPVRTAGGFAIGTATPLFGTEQFRIDGFHQSYAPTPDGKGFLFIGQGMRAPRGGRAQVVIAEQWLEELRRGLRP